MTQAEALRMFRAGALKWNHGRGTNTGPGNATEIDFVATAMLTEGLELLVALQNDDADALAQQHGWQSAHDLMAFLDQGPETARSVQ